MSCVHSKLVSEADALGDGPAGHGSVGLDRKDHVDFAHTKS